MCIQTTTSGTRRAVEFVTRGGGRRRSSVSVGGGKFVDGRRWERVKEMLGVGQGGRERKREREREREREGVGQGGRVS